MRNRKTSVSTIHATFILDDDIDDVALRPKLFAAVPRDKLQEQVAGLHDWVSGKRSDALFLQTAPGNSYASVDEDGWISNESDLEIEENGSN